MSLQALAYFHSKLQKNLCIQIWQFRADPFLFLIYYIQLMIEKYMDSGLQNTIDNSSSEQSKKNEYEINIEHSTDNNY